MATGARPKAGYGVGRTFTVMDKIQTRVSGLSRKATGFVSQPEPRTIGSHAKGRQLAAGNFRFGGHLVQSPGMSIWDIDPPDALFETETHSFIWLDDMGKVTDGSTRRLSQAWLNTWIAEYGRGKGPGWSPDLVGRRVIRWINHALFLLNGQTVDHSRAYFSSLSLQTNFLARRWSKAPVGLPRFEALTGLTYASVSLEGMEACLKPAIKALSRECREHVDMFGGIITRNPEHLMDVLMNLNWAVAAMEDRGIEIPEPITSAIDRIVPTLMALRHADGGLARFHGGGRGAEGQLDYALTGAVRSKPSSDSMQVAVPTGTAYRPGSAMGYSTLCSGEMTVISDTGAPPRQKASANAHASTLAFEFSSGRRPIVVSCGSGAAFGPDWRRAGRATPSHSTLSVLGVSSAKLSSPQTGELLIAAPKTVRVAPLPENPAHGLVASHDGYAPEFGLTHIRKLEAQQNGRVLKGEDTFCAVSDIDKREFERQMNTTKLQGVPFAIRFHLHPEIETSIDMGGSAVSLQLKGGEIWVFRYNGPAKLTVDPSVYLEKARIKPRATKQIVLSSRLMEYAGRVSWTFTRAQNSQVGYGHA